MYLGNPADPQIIEDGFFFCKENWLALKAGYQRDWVSNRYMKAVSKISGSIDAFEFISDQGVLTLNVIDLLEIYSSGGATRISSTSHTANNIQNKFQTHDQFLWSVGARGIFANWKKASFGLNFNCQRTCPKIKWITTNGNLVRPNSKSKITYFEWQAGVSASYQVGVIFPYIGLKYSNSRASFKYLPKSVLPNTEYFKTKNRRKFGLALGSTISNGSKMSVNVEVRMIDEQAITLAGNVEF